MFSGMTNKVVLEKLDEGYRMPKPMNAPDAYYDIMLHCWNEVPEKRPTFEFLHHYFDDFAIASEDNVYEP